MNTSDHLTKAQITDQQQQGLDRSSEYILIVEGCYIAAQDYIWVASDKLGVAHHTISQNHRHSDIPKLLNQLQAPSLIKDAWQALDNLRIRVSYGKGALYNGQNADEARQYLDIIRLWISQLP